MECFECKIPLLSNMRDTRKGENLMPDDYMQPNALATSFKGGQPGQGLKMHFVTKKGQDRAMIRVGGSSFFLNVAELNKLVLSIEEHSDFIKTHSPEFAPEPPKDYSDAAEDCPSQDSSTCAGCGEHQYCCCTCKPEDLQAVFATDDEIPF